MSKLSPLGQSMASLFTPESERLRKDSSTQAAGGPRSPLGSVKIPGMKELKNHKSGDSLGNPNSPGYEPWGKKKKREEAEAKAGEPAAPQAPGGHVVETASQGPEVIRLAFGWEKLLLTQKKLCEKAKNLFTLLEGPDKYSTQKRSKVLQFKSRGCIVDLDLQQTADQLKEAKDKKAKETG